MTKILLVRHGATDWNITKRAQGQADIDLNDIGREQARALSAELARLDDVVAVYSSDLRRARDTASAIAEAHGVDVTEEAAFREIDQGEWTGLTPKEIGARWPQIWGDARHHTARPGGESPEQVRRRALEGLRRVVAEHPEGTVVVVSHGGTIRWLSAECLGYDDERSGRIRGVGNGGVVCMDAQLQDGRLVLADLRRLDGKTTDLDDPND